MHIIGWSYEADVHCIACARKQFGESLEEVETVDREGNPVHPMFSTAEYINDEYCGDCGACIVEGECTSEPDYCDDWDDAQALASAGFGTDEDYGYFGDE